MLQKIFSTLTLALTDRFEWALLAAFGWGLASILLSPCHLTSIPLIIGYISKQEIISGLKTYYLSFLFAVGILVTLIVVGLITSATGHLLGDIGRFGNVAVVLVFLFVGLYLMDIIHVPVGSINLIGTSRYPRGGAFVLGLLFGFSLGTCTFAFMAPVLGVVFSISTHHALKGISLLAAFALGHCLIIMVAGGLTNVIQKYLDWSGNTRAVIYLRRLFGFLVLCGGIYFLYQYVL